MYISACMYNYDVYGLYRNGIVMSERSCSVVIINDTKLVTMTIILSMYNDCNNIIHLMYRLSHMYKSMDKQTKTTKDMYP